MAEEMLVSNGLHTTEIEKTKYKDENKDEKCEISIEKNEKACRNTL
jgi:hypothetical protein